MKLGALTAPLAGEPLVDVLGFLRDTVKVEMVEIGTGNHPPAAHCDIMAWNADKVDGEAKKRQFIDTVQESGLQLSALSCHGNPVHPDELTANEHGDRMKATVEFAAQIREATGSPVVVCGFSGLPAGGKLDHVPNWVTAPWPNEHAAALEYQWEIVVNWWKEFHDSYLQPNKVPFAIEMHPNFLVHHPRSMVRLRKEAGTYVCCNFDPSHLFWRGAKPHRSVRWMADNDPFKGVKGAPPIIVHSHAKDTAVDQDNVEIHGCVDEGPYTQFPDRAWSFRTCGLGHGTEVWVPLLTEYRLVGYDLVLSLEHEDGLGQDRQAMVLAADFFRRILLSLPPTKPTWV
jgi:sugar phosphate isomerase/epimerase